ncbi:thioredoxin family protein [bacterium]|nr:thioredoxin family protein [bacterium]
MKKIILSLVLVSALIGGVMAGEGIGLGENIPMANEKMMNIDNNKLSIADVKGEHGTLVMFSCNHCPWVKAWETRIASICNEYMEKGFGVIVINSNDPSAYEDDSFESMVKRAAEMGFKFPYVVDSTSEVAKAFGASKTPEVYLFNEQDKLVYHGAIDDNAQEADKVENHYLINALNSVMSDEKPAMQETKALGCGIKFRS